MKKLLISLFLAVGVPSLATPCYAWKGGGTRMKIAKFVLAPIWIPMAIGFKLQDYRSDQRVESSRQEILEARKKLKEFYTAISDQIKNDLRLYSAAQDADFDPVDGLRRLQDFLERFANVEPKFDSEALDPGTFLCQFRQKLLSDLAPGSLDARVLGKMFDQYDETGQIPPEYFDAAQTHLQLSQQAAERVFGILYVTSLKAGVPMSTFYVAGR